MTTPPSNIPTPRTDALEKAIDEFWSSPECPHGLEDAMKEADRRGLTTFTKHARTLERELSQLEEVAKAFDDLFKQETEPTAGHIDKVRQSYENYLKEKGKQ